MSQTKQGNMEGEERYSTLLNNAAAIRAVCSAVEGTLGPKGLDAMLVGARGDVIITNDGVTILDKMDVSHPAARLLIQVARSQQSRVGDGTTTATVLAGALVSEGAAHVTRGVPAAKIVHGIRDGIERAIAGLTSRARPIEGLDDPMLRRIALIAGREQRDIAELVITAAERLGTRHLLDDEFRFADTVFAHEKAANEVWPGIFIGGKPLEAHAETAARGTAVLVVQDALEPETLDEEALATEAGFAQYIGLKQQFKAQLEKLVSIGVGLIVVERGAAPEAEQFCADHGIMLIRRALRRDVQSICEFTGARPLKRMALNKSAEELASCLGRAEEVYYDPKLERVRLAGGSGKPVVTVVVGAATAEVVGERARIAKDAAAAVQAAVRGGYLPGGGAVEIAVAHELERYRETVKGMEGFGIAAVAQALRKPLAQIVVNAGFNPLEKVEEVRAAQIAEGSDAIGIDCDTGALTDCLRNGIADPAIVKAHALQAAGEVACAVLRIHSVIKMKPDDA